MNRKHHENQESWKNYMWKLNHIKFLCENKLIIKKSQMKISEPCGTGSHG